MHPFISGIEDALESLHSRLKSPRSQVARATRLATDLRNQMRVPDEKFDRIYPLRLQRISKRHWTSIEVALRAAELLATDTHTRTLDVGSGCGKFCVAAALSAPGHFIGVEERPDLLEIAKRAAEELGANTASFIPGNMMDLDWDEFDAFYLFNPFYENQLPEIRIDTKTSPSLEKFDLYVATVETKLRNARRGTRVVTYHGFGGEMPGCYEQRVREAIGSDYLELWIKTET